MIWRSLAKLSSTETSFAVTAGAGICTTAGLLLAGNEPNHFSTSFLASATSKSPAIAIVAFAGTYQVRKKFFTSSTDAATRSSCLPIVR